MLETRKANDLFQIDEMVNDKEFAERVYQNSISEAMVNFYTNENLIWADML